MRYDERGERERDTIEQECGLGRYRSGGWGDGGRVKQENILNTDLPMHRKTPTPSGVILSMKSENEKRNRGECKVRPRSRNHSPKRSPVTTDYPWLAPSRPATRFCNIRRWLGLLHPSPHAPSSAAGPGDPPRSRSRPPVHTA